MVVDALTAMAGAERGQLERDAWVAEGRLAGEPVLLVKPLTFMNRSGEAVAALLDARGGEASEVVAIVDDVALPLGTLRVRGAGSHGGHNGLRSMAEMLGTDEFARVRLGIAPAEPPVDLAAFVLAEFPEQEVLVVQEMVGRAAEAVECLVGRGVVTAMSLYNGPKRESAP
jgi:PTH1 family peptidyl-tRNA hydrolase